MSGGSYDYLYMRVESMAQDHRLTHGSALRRAFSAHLLLVSKAMHAIEWVDSSDWSKGDEYKAIAAALAHPTAQEVAQLISEARRLHRELTAALKQHSEEADDHS